MLNNEYHLWCTFCFLVQSVFCFCKLRVRTYRRRFLTNNLQSRRNTRYPPITWGMSQSRKMQPSESARGRRMMRNMDRTCIMLKMEWTNLESAHAKLWITFQFFSFLLYHWPLEMDSPEWEHQEIHTVGPIPVWPEDSSVLFPYIPILLYLKYKQLFLGDMFLDLLNMFMVELYSCFLAILHSREHSETFTFVGRF